MFDPTWIEKSQKETQIWTILRGEEEKKAPFFFSESRKSLTPANSMMDRWASYGRLGTLASDPSYMLLEMTLEKIYFDIHLCVETSRLLPVVF